MINSLLIIIFGKIYKKISGWLLKIENHRYDQDLEDSKANKIYMFSFINTYISNLVVVCYNQNFGALTTNLTIVMIFKQVVINSIEYFTERISIGKKIRKSDELFKQPIDDAKSMDDELMTAHMEMHCSINRQMCMKPATKSLVPYYNEAMI